MRLTRPLNSLAVLIFWAGIGLATPETPLDVSGTTNLITDFEEKDVSEGWKTVNDNVMGGRSTGGPSFGEGRLTFQGSTNTDGGGFSTVRTQPGEHDLSGMAGLLIRVKGDGRTYKMGLRTNVRNGWSRMPFRADFATEEGKWKEVFLPFASFGPTFHGRSLKNAPALDLSQVSSFEFMIYDKKDGPFLLEVDWIKAVREM